MTVAILLVTREQNRFITFTKALETSIPAAIHWAESGTDALSTAKSLKPLLAVVDESLPDMSGLEFVRKLMMVNALIYTTVVSRLDPEAFHEASEGLGVLLPLPLLPGEGEAKQIISALVSISAIPAG